MHNICICFNVFNLTYAMSFLFYYCFYIQKLKNNCERKYIPEVKFATN